MKVAVVGLGVMGAPMAARVAGAGHEVVGYDVAEQARQRPIEGVVVAETLTTAVDGAEVVALSLPTPAAVDAVVGQVLAIGRPAALVDWSTNDVDMVRRLHRNCAEAGVGFLDAPVSGGVARARTGDLAVMVGGDEATLDLARPVLEAVGSSVLHVGPVGTGTIAKLVNNQLFLAAGALVQEAYLTAEALGLAPADLDPVLAASSAGPYAKLAPLLVGRRFDDVIFRLDIASKDLDLAGRAAHAVGVDTPVTDAAAELYRSAVEAGDGEKVFHATLAELERRAGREITPFRRPRRSPKETP